MKAGDYVIFKNTFLDEIIGYETFLSLEEAVKGAEAFVGEYLEPGDDFAIAKLEDPKFVTPDANDILDFAVGGIMEYVDNVEYPPDLTRDEKVELYDAFAKFWAEFVEKHPKLKLNWYSYVDPKNYMVRRDDGKVVPLPADEPITPEEAPMSMPECAPENPQSD